MKFKSVAVFAALTSSALLLSACAPADDAAEAQIADPDEITVMVSNVPSAGALKAIAPLYREETGITVTFVEVPSDQLATKAVLDGQSKSGSFDIVQLDQPTLAQVVPAGGLQPLDRYLEEDTEYDIDDFSPALQEYSKFDGETYGLPLSTEPYVNFYRTDVFEELGLEAPTTWDEVDSSAEQVSALGDGYHGYAGPYGPAAAAERYFERLMQNGGRVLDPETNEPLLDTDFAKEILADFVALAEYTPEVALSGVASDSATAFQQESIGQNINPSGWYGRLDDPEASRAAGNVGVAAVPSEANGPYEPQNILKGWLIGVNASSTKQDAAWDFLAFALGKENVQSFIDEGAPVVGRTSTLTDPTFVEQLPYLEHLQPTIDSGAALPSLGEFPQISGEVSQAINSIVLEGADLDSTMDSVNESVWTLLEQGGALQK